MKRTAVDGPCEGQHIVAKDPRDTVDPTCEEVRTKIMRLIIDLKMSLREFAENIGSTKVEVYKFTQEDGETIYSSLVYKFASEFLRIREKMITETE